MTEGGRRWASLLGAFAAAIALVVAIDLLTNSIDTQKFSWDFRYYMGMAEHGLAPPLASPFAYRYVTPLLARAVSGSLELPVQAGFAIVAYLGAIAQLLAVFLFTSWYTRSRTGAWLAMLVVAFSLFNVKFLLFDIFRPDHLAYPLLLLQVFLALTGRFPLLLVATLLGCQIREFNAIPLVAYACSRLGSLGTPASGSQRSRTGIELAAAVLVLGAALALPRLLIPVAEDFQFATLTRDGILRAALAPFILSRDANFVFSVIAYLLPLLFLAGPQQILTTFSGLDRSDRIFLGVYTALVLAFSFLGGTDFFRFSTYLLVPQCILLGLLADQVPRWRLGAVLIATLLFNRVWLPFPVTDLDAYLDFYGGYGTRFTPATVLRIGELIALIGLGILLRRFTGKGWENRPRAAG